MVCWLDFVFDNILLHYYIITLLYNYTCFIVGGGLLLVLVRLRFTNVPPRLDIFDVFSRSEDVLSFSRLIKVCVH